MQICSQSLLSLIIQNKTMVNASLVRACSGRLTGKIPRHTPLRPALLVLLLAAVLFWQWQANPSAKVKMAQVLGSVLFHHQEVVPAGPPLPVVVPENRQQADQEASVAVAMADPAQPSATSVAEPDPKAEAEAEAVLAEAAETERGSGAASDSASGGKILEPEDPFRRILADPMLFPGTPLLGKLKVKNGDSLSRMIKRVYGDFNGDLLRMVATANPQLRDTNMIPAGTMIRFPAPCRPYRKSNHPGYRLLLDTESTLVDAYHFMKGCSDSSLEVRIMPVWSPENGLAFMIISVQEYEGEEEAMAVLEKLPANLAHVATVLHKWEEGYLHLANPVPPGI